MTKTFHLALSVRGALIWPRGVLTRACQGIYTPEGDRCLTPDELKRALMDELAVGHDYVPIGQCDNFDFESGCVGHENEVTE